MHGRDQRNRRVTLADVAERAGVHHATVSQTLNNRKNSWTSAATRKRILEAADALHYRPNLTARALRSGRSHVIGFISPGFGVASSHSWADGLSEAAAGQNYTVILSSHRNDSDSEDRLIGRLLDRGVDGLVIYPIDHGPHNELRRLVDEGFPVVTFEGANLLDFPCDDASVDLIAAGQMQASHLQALGRRRICIANALPAARVNDIRDDGIRKGLAASGAPEPLLMDIRRPAEGESPEAICEQIRAFVKAHRGAFDAVASYDRMSSLAVRVLLELGIRIPEEVAVIGCGDQTVASYGAIPLTSINTRTDEAAAQGFGLLMERIEGRRTGADFRSVTGTLTLRTRRSTIG